MSYVFVSHASEDKLLRVRPLVHALAFAGVRLWIDRPGHGDSHFNFDQSFVQRYGIQGLRSGLPWDQQILEAHRGASVVLACLSRALCAERHVLVDELVLAAYANKLVACIVDDLPFAEIPRELGLIDAPKLQARRIDAGVLAAAVAAVADAPTCDEEMLQPDMRAQWQIVRELVVDIEHVSGEPTISHARMAATKAAVAAVPIGPMVRAHEIPAFVTDLFSRYLSDPDRARRFLARAMQLRVECNAEAFDEKQIAVTAGEVLNPDKNSAEVYWADVLTVAGMKSRRTLAALLLMPDAPISDKFTTGSRELLQEFMSWLQNQAHH